MILVGGKAVPVILIGNCVSEEPESSGLSDFFLISKTLSLQKNQTLPLDIEFVAPLLLC